MVRSTRHRLRIALAALFCLLAQQTALAAYLCPVERMPAQVSAMGGGCADMGMSQTKTAAALCDKHCHPDHPLAPDDATLSVPPLALPPAAFGLVFVPATRHVAGPAQIPIMRSDPPPRLRYCSLLI